MTVSNERKNLTRLAGEFLVASRLTQRGYMIALQWGTTIGYDILVFDKQRNVAYIEVKTSASNAGKWVLQKKYATPRDENIPVKQRFVCCVDLSATDAEPRVYVFPALVLADALSYSYGGRFSQSKSYRLDLSAKPRGQSRDAAVACVGDHMKCDAYRERYDLLGVQPLHE